MRMPEESQSRMLRQLNAWTFLSSNHKSLFSITFSFLLVQLFCKPFQLVAPVQFPHLLRILPPIGRNFHEQSQVNLAAKDRFQFFSSLGADFLQHLALVTD